MPLFTFDPAEIRDRYARDGWAHISRGADPAFVADVCDQLARRVPPVERQGVTVAKDQFLLDLPDDGLLAELAEALGVICGLAPDRFTLSERHVNVYAPDAAPTPRPHKDRFASQVSVGISIAVPVDSRLALWPDTARGVNPLQRAGLAEELHPDDAPDAVLAGIAPTVIHDAPGDVMIFPGSDVWHTRHYPAGAVVLYLKANDFGSDPLGEDPRTAAIERRSHELVGGDDAVATRGRRLESVTQEFSLATGTDWWNVHVAGARPQRITAAELALLRRLDRPTPVAGLVGASVSARRAVDRLATIGAVTLTDCVGAGQKPSGSAKGSDTTGATATGSMPSRSATPS